MNMIERGRAFVESLQSLAHRSAWDWRRCPSCGGWETYKNGSYVRHPWTFEGRKRLRVQRHWCVRCRRSYSEQVAWLAARKWYGREVQRYAIDQWQHTGSSLRRTAEGVRSWIGRQERWLIWRPWEQAGENRCHLVASTVHRWLDGAGRQAQEQSQGAWEGIASSERLGVDGLWVRLREGSKRAVLLVVDSVSGLLYPPVVAAEEESAAGWGALFERAKAAGLDLQTIRGLTSDGAHGLMAYLEQSLRGVNQQRCVWHVWRNLKRPLGKALAQAVKGLAKQVAQPMQQQLRVELERLIHAVLDAPSYLQAEQELAHLLAHPSGVGLSKILNELLDRLFVYCLPEQQGLLRLSPEWVWRDFRLRLSHGRNHGSEQRLERAALLWAIYHNFTPAQGRSERKRHYKHPGQSALQVSGASPGPISYLDALAV
jgi:transposase-like protein